MSTELPEANTSGRQPDPKPAAPPRRKKPILFAAGILLGVTLGAVVLWRSFGTASLPDPPAPAGITDAEVQATLDAARAKVLADRTSASAWGEYGNVLLANLFDREANACFIQASLLDPGDPRWLYGRGQIALKRDPPNALALLESAADATGDGSEYREAFTLALAESLFERGQMDQAEALFEKELRRSNSPRAAFGLGTIAMARGDDAKALKQFTAVRSDPSCRKQVAVHLATLARARGDIAAAGTFEAEANSLDTDPPWPDPYLDRIVTLQVGFRGTQRRVALLERNGQFAEAADAYLEQARVNRTSKALTGAAVNLARLKQYDRAIALMREAVQLEPTDSAARYTLALVLFTKGERLWVTNPASTEAASIFHEVVSEAKKTTELKPDHTSAYMLWGLALKNLGEPRAAVEPLRKGISIQPSVFDLHLGLGQCLAAISDTAGAAESLNRAHELKPDDPRPVSELSKLKGK